jgi:DNA-binding transcriptional ArsR family regulator
MLVNSQTPHPQRVFYALGSLPRRQIIAFLSQTALSTADLAERFRMSRPAISRHLSVLERAGLIAGERHGQRVLYRLRRDELLGALGRFALEVDGALQYKNPRDAL